MYQAFISIKLFTFILFSLTIINFSALQGASLEQGPPRSNLQYLRLPIKEKLEDNFSEISTELDNKTSHNPLLSLQIETSTNLNEDEENLSNASQSASDLYVQAFKEESNFSRSLAFKCMASLILGFGPTIPQLAIALKVGKYYRSEFLSYLLIGATVLYIEGITSWMIWEFIEDTQKLMKTFKHHKNNSTRCNTQSTKVLGIGALSLILGALSSAPDVYKAYKYNKVKELAIISFIYDTIPRTLGFYKLLSSLEFASNNMSKEDYIAKTQGIEFINSSKISLLEHCKRDGTINVSRNLKSYNNACAIYSYLTKDSQQNTESNSLPHNPPNHIKTLTEYSVLIFPTASTGFNMVLAYKGYNLLIDNPILTGFLAGFSVLPPFILSCYVIKRATGELFDKFYTSGSKKNAHYFSVFHPRINNTMIGTSLVLGGITSIGGFYLANNLDDTFLSPAKYIFAALGMVTDITFGAYTMYSSWVNFGEVTQKTFNRRSSYVLGCLKKLDEVGEVITNSDTSLVRNFINEFISFQNAAFITQTPPV